MKENANSSQSSLSLYVSRLESSLLASGMGEEEGIHSDEEGSGKEKEGGGWEEEGGRGEFEGGR